MSFIPDREELAWAGGFFCGEGCAYVQTNTPSLKFKRPRSYKRGRVCVSQTTNDANIVPEVLTRFHNAIGGLGHISGPFQPKTSKSKPYYSWGSNHFHEVQAIVAMLWPWLSHQKREAARVAMAASVEEFFRPKLKRGPKPRAAR
jgi:hypothetical protein